MDHHSVAYVGFDTSKTKHAVAVAEGGRGHRQLGAGLGGEDRDG